MAWEEDKGSTARLPPPPETAGGAKGGSPPQGPGRGKRHGPSSVNAWWLGGSSA
jgi:hypothetical protein